MGAGLLDRSLREHGDPFERDLDGLIRVPENLDRPLDLHVFNSNSQLGVSGVAGSEAGLTRIVESVVILGGSGPAVTVRAGPRTFEQPVDDTREAAAAILAEAARKSRRERCACSAIAVLLTAVGISST